jgi:hypothetical protein
MMPQALLGSHLKSVIAPAHDFASFEAAQRAVAPSALAAQAVDFSRPSENDGVLPGACS